MDAHDSLLLSEGVCCQLGIISYHPSVKMQIPTKKNSSPWVTNPRVNLLNSVSLLPLQTTMVAVCVGGNINPSGSLRIEPSSDSGDVGGDGLHFSVSLVSISAK